MILSAFCGEGSGFLKNSLLGRHVPPGTGLSSFLVQKEREQGKQDERKQGA